MSVGARLLDAPVWTDLLFRLFVGGDGEIRRLRFFLAARADFFAKADGSRLR